MNGTQVASYFDYHVALLDRWVTGRELTKIREYGARLAELCENENTTGIANVQALLVEGYRRGYKVALKNGVDALSFDFEDTLTRWEDTAQQEIDEAQAYQDHRDALEVEADRAYRAFLAEQDAPGDDINRLSEGTYTLEYEDGTWKTFRVRVVKTGNLKGKKAVEYLMGPDNTLDFQMFAFVNEGKGRTTVNVWNKYEGGPLVNLAREIEAFAIDGDLEGAGLCYALRSSRCRRCNAVLTVPASIHRGYGPDCIQKIMGM